MLDDQNSTCAGHAPADPKSIDPGAALSAVIATFPMSGRWLAIRVLAHVVVRAARRGGEVRLSQHMIARDLRLSPARVRKAIEQIRVMPGLELQACKGRVSIWRLVDNGGQS